MNMMTQQSREDALRDFKNLVREWLQEHGKSAKWLALNIRKSTGTVKNWLYTPLNITDANQDAIRSVLRRYESGESSLCSEKPEEVVVEYLQISSEVQPAPKLPLWCNAAEVPSSCFSVRDESEIMEEYGNYGSHMGYATYNVVKDLAEWATKTLMIAAANVLQPLYEKVKDDSEKISVFMQMETDGGSMLSSRPACVYGKSCDLRIRKAGADCEGKKEIVYLPIVRNQWQEVYVEMAAVASGRRGTIEWICETLNRAAVTQSASNMEDFFTRMRVLAEDSAPANLPLSDDDIPF